MITARAFAGKHYAVYGLARSGLATVEALLASGARVTAWDGKAEARNKLLPGTGRGTATRSGVVEGAPLQRSPQPEDGARLASLAPLHHPSDGPPPRSEEDLQIADLDTSDLSKFDSLVVTPGLPLNRHPIAARARDAGVEIIGDIELFARARPELPPHKVVGITGTNGKSTTTALVHHILKTAGVPTTMGGNIGLPILAQNPLPEGGVYVLELSSYQIDLTQSLDCDVAVLLNITPDHLDRYESFEAYAASKARLFNMQSGDHLAIARIEEWFGKGVVERSNAGTLQLLEEVWENFDFDPSLSATSEQSNWPALQGPHNLENAAAAVAVCYKLGLTGEQMREGLETYPGLPHRMERVRDLDGVLFLNDSKATNPTATAPALAAYDRIRWICGGQAKTDNLDECAPHFGHVRSAYTIGEAADLFERLLSPHIAVQNCGKLGDAVLTAARDAQPGDTVLLSPACASFDQFRDFEDRGDQFRAMVGAL
ncbi:UDP-N-acetylmuramoyl-L-alanine--D-glutamate ligase [Sphingomonas sp.]|uniref:UDP-N-acetylmuramoyl-L-alanine--D-glutamate ligase n=1 Tax=Sphingomonas sp. TaxID=28214 RepID=UPI0025D522BF|nr:UDP-N-acetylmuramoyl-L-alanine--D-glutamate ligase [Sphingomonas sp.]MBV9527120.1 UDP-N-acetylmuramoyl-L-alanine--D-glutamate ligase [Sphingomonas sp.]